MTTSIKLAVIAAMAMGTTSAFATNGDNLIGLGAVSRGMGGTGIAHFMGAESTLSNPGLLAKQKGTEISFGGTYFHPSVEVTTTAGQSPLGPTAFGDHDTSDAKHNVIPEVAIAMELGDGFTFGIGMFGSAGMGVDFSDSPAIYGEAVSDGSPAYGGAPAGTVFPGTNVPYSVGLYSMKSSLQLMKFAPSIAYGQDNWGIGVAAVIQYGNLAMSFTNPAPVDGTGASFVYADNYNGQGASQDFGLGWQAGAYVEPIDGLVIGANYTSSIDMEYKNQISYISQQFGYAPGTFSDHLEQPAEYGMGVAFTMSDLTLTTDIKRTEWAKAKGYEDFGWQSTNGIAIGGQYVIDDLALRAGFNYAEMPLEGQLDTRLNLLNYVMFPATTQRHYTLGAGYAFSKQTALDFALTWAPQQETNVSGEGNGVGNINTKHEQYGVSAALKFNF